MSGLKEYQRYQNLNIPISIVLLSKTDEFRYFVIQSDVTCVNETLCDHTICGDEPMIDGYRVKTIKSAQVGKFRVA